MRNCGAALCPGTGTVMMRMEMMTMMRTMTAHRQLEAALREAKSVDRNQAHPLVLGTVRRACRAVGVEEAGPEAWPWIAILRLQIGSDGPDCYRLLPRKWWVCFDGSSRCGTGAANRPPSSQLGKEIRHHLEQEEEQRVACQQLPVHLLRNCYRSLQEAMELGQGHLLSQAA